MTVVTEAHETTMDRPRCAAMTAPGTSRARMGRGVQHPVPVEIFCWSAGRFETVLAVNYAAARELVQKINAEKGTKRHACIGKVGEPLRTANSRRIEWMKGQAMQMGNAHTTLDRRSFLAALDPETQPIAAPWFRGGSVAAIAVVKQSRMVK